MPWNSEQQRLLRAMGYVLYAQAPVTTAETMPTEMAIAGAKQSAALDLSRLLQALRKAARGGDVSAVIADVAALHGNAGAKRALWPKLRALRRPH